MSFTTPYFTLPKFVYLKPSTLEEALSMLKQYKGKAKVKAGGIMLINLMKERQIVPEYVIDLKNIKELKTINITQRGVEIGSMVTAIELQNSKEIKELCPTLAKAASFMGDRTLQHTVTLGGNISVAMPSTDGLTALMSMDSMLEIKSAEERRFIHSSELVIGLGKNSLKEDEIITKIIVPYNGDVKGTYLKFLNASEVAIATVAVTAHLNKKKFALVVGALAPKPYYFNNESLQWNWEEPVSVNIQRASEIVSKTVEPMSDVVASSEYRKHISKVLTARALKEVFGGE